MPRYWLEKPTSYVVDNTLVVHTRVTHADGSPVVIELDERVAADLGDAVRLVNENPDEVVPVVDPPKRPQKAAKPEEDAKVDETPNGG